MKTENNSSDEKKEAGDKISPPDIVGGQPCPMCHENKLTLTEAERDVPFFGKVYLFSMDCEGCKFHKADVETDKSGEGVKITFEITSEKDLSTRIIKSSDATIKLPRITTIEPGPASNGYVTNLEGIFNRVKHQIEVVRDTAEEDEDRNKAKSLLKKIRRVMWGEEPITITIEDPSGNSAIISEKAVVTKLGSKK